MIEAGARLSEKESWLIRSELRPNLEKHIQEMTDNYDAGRTTIYNAIHGKKLTEKSAPPIKELYEMAERSKALREEAYQ